MEFDRYFNNAELEAILDEWTARHPNLLAKSSIGASHEGRPIWLVTLTNTAAGAPEEKPALWLDANIHATEIAGTTTLLCFLDHVLSSYSSNPQVTRLVDTTTFYIVPRINPDGAAAALADQPRYLRSGVRPYPWLEAEEGLHIQDIDGDSRILQMRIPDHNGDWKASEQDARLMVKRSPVEQGGTYYRILPEGLLENYDGYQIKQARPLAGLDFNRNFPFEWRPENEQHGSGPFPASEPEINAVVRFVAQHPNISAGLTFHTFSRVLLRPFSSRPDEQMIPADLEVFKTLGEMGTQITGYRNVSTFHDFTYHPGQVTTGAFDDWLYDHLGAFTFTVELWDLPTEAGIKDRKFIEWFGKHPLEDDLKIFKWVDDNVGEQGYVSWYPFDHPQLGQVELGGWNTLYTWRNPPPHFMGKEARLHLDLIKSFAEILPRLELHACKAQKIGADTWAIDLVVDNPGYLPTFTSQQARKRQAVRPVYAQVDLPDGAEIVQGKERMEIGHLEGRSNKADAASVFASSPTDNRGRAQWVIRAAAGTQIAFTVSAERAGALKCALTLE